MVSSLAHLCIWLHLWTLYPLRVLCLFTPKSIESPYALGSVAPHYFPRLRSVAHSRKDRLHYGENALMRNSDFDGRPGHPHTLLKPLFGGRAFLSVPEEKSLSFLTYQPNPSDSSQAFLEAEDADISDPEAVEHRLRLLLRRRLHDKAAKGEDTKRILEGQTKTLDDMDRKESIAVLGQLYRLPGEKIVADSVQKLDDEMVRKRIRTTVHEFMEKDEGTRALDKFEGGDSLVSSRSEVAMGLPKGRTGFIVYLFNLVLRKISGYDILERAGEESYKERIRTKKALEMGVDPDSLDSKLVDTLLKERLAKTRPYRGVAYDPFAEDPFAESDDEL